MKKKFFLNYFFVVIFICFCFAKIANCATIFDEYSIERAWYKKDIKGLSSVKDMSFNLINNETSWNKIGYVLKQCSNLSFLTVNLDSGFKFDISEKDSLGKAFSSVGRLITKFNLVLSNNDLQKKERAAAVIDIFSSFNKYSKLDELYLDLSNCRLNTKIFKDILISIANIKTLKKITISLKNNKELEAVRELSKIKRIVRWVFWKGKVINSDVKDGLSALSKCPINSIAMDFSDCKLSDEFVCQIFNGITDIFSKSKLDREKKLFVSLKDNSFKNLSLKAFENLLNLYKSIFTLKVLNLNIENCGSDIKSVFSSLYDQRDLIELSLNLANNDFKNDAIEQLGKSLETKPALRNLFINLDNNDMNDSKIDLLLNNLKEKGKNLRELNLSLKNKDYKLISAMSSIGQGGSLVWKGVTTIIPFGDYISKVGEFIAGCSSGLVNFTKDIVGDIKDSITKKIRSSGKTLIEDNAVTKINNILISLPRLEVLKVDVGDYTMVSYDGVSKFVASVQELMNNNKHSIQKVFLNIGSYNGMGYTDYGKQAQKSKLAVEVENANKYLQIMLKDKSKSANDTLQKIKHCAKKLKNYYLIHNNLSIDNVGQITSELELLKSKIVKTKEKDIKKYKSEVSELIKICESIVEKKIEIVF